MDDNGEIEEEKEEGGGYEGPANTKLHFLIWHPIRERQHMQTYRHDQKLIYILNAIRQSCLLCMCVTGVNQGLKIQCKQAH